MHSHAPCRFAAIVALLVAGSGCSGDAKPASGDMVLVVTEARHEPSVLADKLAPKLGATRSGTAERIALSGGGANVVIASDLAGVERDVGSGALAPKKLVVYFTGKQGGMSNAHKQTFKAIAAKKIPVVACVQADDAIDDKELVELQKTECKGSLEEVGYGVGTLQQLVVNVAAGTGMDQLATTLK